MLPFLPSDFDYQLPDSSIAQIPLEPRDSSKLLVLDSQTNSFSHHHFSDLASFLGPNDVLIFNQTKVIPARLYGHKKTGAKLEILLLNQISQDTWKLISKPGLRPGQVIHFDLKLSGQVLEFFPKTGESIVTFNQTGAKFLNTLDLIGHTPIPPYIKTQSPESFLRQIYQTVYAKNKGSAAAPTAGLHFTPRLLQELKKRGVTLEYLTLHVGLGTFQPLKAENLKTKKLHSEYFQISSSLAKRLNLAKKKHKRLIAVGTTTARALESASTPQGILKSCSGQTDIFIYPGVKFKFVDSLITNFHLPQSSLLMLVSALLSFPNTSEKFTNFPLSLMGKAYQEALNHKYRFFSFGDAMWIK